MMGFQRRRGRAVAACVVLAVALGGCAPLWTRSSPHSAPPAEAARSAAGKTFDKWCSDCHSTAGGPGSLALQRKYRGNLPAVLEQRNDLRPDYVTLVVRHGISFMPSFRKTEISDADLALLAAYLAPSHTSSDGSALNKAGGE
jgi:mono/diheme cytochrome c family protein